MKSANTSTADDACNLPPAAADAWAAVYIDVAKKLDAEEQADVSAENASISGEEECPATSRPKPT